MSSRNRPRVYVETSVYASVFSKEKMVEDPFPRWQIAEDILRRDDTQRIEVVTSTLPVVEVNAGMFGAIDARDLIRQYFAHADRLLIEVDYAIAARTRELFWQIADQGMPKVPLEVSRCVRHMGFCLTHYTVHALTRDDLRTNLRVEAMQSLRA